MALCLSFTASACTTIQPEPVRNRTFRETADEGAVPSVANTNDATDRQTMQLVLTIHTHGTSRADQIPTSSAAAAIERNGMASRQTGRIGNGT